VVVGGNFAVMLYLCVANHFGPATCSGFTPYARCINIFKVTPT
jgi:hypothetical protein